jgi:anti-sigma regulatory factor (Ser/Thr protein kinase)
MHREFLIPATSDAAEKARYALGAMVPPPHLAARFEDARLVITEVVTNAVRHAGLDRQMIRLTIDADQEQVRVETEQATDATGAHLVEPAVDGEKTGGFGLMIVEQLSDDWGVEPGPPGMVWFLFRR